MLTEQEKFWAGSFGDQYVERNKHGLATSVHIFSQVLEPTRDVKSCLEIGCNIGLNLDALRILKPDMRLCGVEINATAAKGARAKGHEIVEGSALDATILAKIETNAPFDLVFTKGVAIHITPDRLNILYDAMFRLSSRYLMVCEYYNPTPTTIPYRGNDDKLFKRDFAGDLMERHSLRLVDYRFYYRRDPNYPADDLTYFLLERV